MWDKSIRWYFSKNWEKTSNSCKVNLNKGFHHKLYGFSFRSPKSSFRFSLKLRLEKLGSNFFTKSMVCGTEIGGKVIGIDKEIDY